MPARRVLVVLVSGAAAAAVLGAPAGAAGPGATAEAVNCKPIQREVARSSGADRTSARRRLKACKATNTANKKTLALVKGGRYVGVRGDGQQEDWTFCANGAYRLASTSGGSTGTSTGTRWRTADATFKSASSFKVIIEDPSEGLSVALVRTGGQWQVGVARSFGEVESLGNATRTPATTC